MATLLWLQGGACSGNTMSLNIENYQVVEAMLQQLALRAFADLLGAKTIEALERP